MRKAWVLLLLLALGSAVQAQRAVSFRVSFPPSGAGIGLGLEAPLERDTALRLYGELFPGGPSVLLVGEFLFKPDLGQLDRDLRGIRPYFGGGLGVRVPSGASPDLGLGLALGVEFLLEARTGVFLEGAYFYPFGGGQGGRLVLGANLR
ncbi:MAG: hypothetical protein WHT26_11820 [Thermus sp.]|uniref:hypothetical protein n=1 Tax=Thermus sp. TaxID=275 RepID=UPI0030AEE46B